MHAGWKNILWGLAVIGVGLAYGGSIFLGNPDGIDYVFDILGIGLVGFGVFQLINSRKE